MRAFSILNGVREWFSFAGEAVSLLGIAKRAAVATAGVAAGAAVVAPVVHLVQQPAQPATVAQPASASEVEDKIEKIGPGNIYSKVYLSQPEHQGLLGAIIAKCKATNELPAVQCDIAVASQESVEAERRNAAMVAAMRRARARREQAPDSTIMLPFEQTIVK